MIVTRITPLEKGRSEVCFEGAAELILYKGEIQKLGLAEDCEVSPQLYAQIYDDIVGKRAIKRALHLLEKMDRTEAQLRRKLEEGRYPEELIDRAADYVKSYRYIDDERYARTFIRNNQTSRSTARMRQDLLSRGVARDLVERALEEEQETPQEELILKLLEKKHYEKDAPPKEKRRMYQFLLRRGFRTEEIMRVLNALDIMPGKV